MQIVELNEVVSTEEESCFGKLYDPDIEDCMSCIDAEACKVAMEKPKKKAKAKKKKEVKDSKIFSLPPPIVISKTEFKELHGALLTFQEDYIETKIIKTKKEKPSKEKGMRKPPFVGRGGKGNTASYIEWLLFSGKWTFEEMITKAQYYLDKHGKRQVTTPMDKYIKGCISWFKKNKGIIETISENGKIKLSL